MTMSDTDHNAILAMYEHMECENPFDQEGLDDLQIDQMKIHEKENLYN